IGGGHRADGPAHQGGEGLNDTKDGASTQGFGELRARQGGPFAHGRGKGVGRHGKGNHEGGKEGHERSTVIDGVAGCAWRTFRIRRFAPALVSASAIL